jgi:hypothetical protein
MVINIPTHKSTCLSIKSSRRVVLRLTLCSTLDQHEPCQDVQQRCPHAQAGQLE